MDKKYSILNRAQNKKGHSPEGRAQMKHSLSGLQLEIEPLLAERKQSTMWMTAIKTVPVWMVFCGCVQQNILLEKDEF